MTKYLKQTAQVENHVLDEQGQPKLDVYGRPLFGQPIAVPCRRERFTARGSTAHGQYVNYSHTYYFDETVTIGNGDKIDGFEVQNIETYVDGSGTVVGYEVNV